MARTLKRLKIAVFDFYGGPIHYRSPELLPMDGSRAGFEAGFHTPTADPPNRSKEDMVPAELRHKWAVAAHEKFLAPADEAIPRLMERLVPNSSAESAV